MGGNELLPGGLLAPLWRRGDAVTPEHVRHRLVRYTMTEVGQGSHDPIVSPAGVLSGHTYDQGFGFTINGRSARIGSALGSVELAGDQPPVPGQDRVGPGDTSHLCQSPTAESLAHFSQGGSRRIGQPQTGGKV